MRRCIKDISSPGLIVIFVLLFSFCAIADCKGFEGSFEVSPLELVSPKRADLMAKYIYAKQREWRVNASFPQDVYYRHLQVWNGFWEFDPPKRSFDDFLWCFNSLLDSVKDSGFDPSRPIPLGMSGSICNGAHRLTSCLLYGEKIFVKKVPFECSYGFEYFKERGLEDKYLDAMALQYCELKNDSYMMVVFPSAVGYESEIEKIINDHAEIVYKKIIPFTTNGGFNFILTAYEEEGFVKEGINNDYFSARYKARQCFPEGLTDKNPARVYLLKCEGLGLIKACKNKIRSLFNIYNDSVHSTDTHEQAIILARALFNKNSLHWLNHKKDAYFPLFDFYFEKYRHWLRANGKENDWFCVDSGAVLAAYGLRECSDLDFLHHELEVPSAGIPGIDSHNCHVHYHALSLDEILFDPDNYFFYKGVKFCALPTLARMKERRGEPKDHLDIALINQNLN